ncbi:right-handed parallel beta-helix repeat-containing protein [Cupriavidus plantarum]|uniref:Parallel beta helix pectate lyase-like protein n=1 Tax=Cupriavidus plantarum TaxID=942865 RepID=A0A316ETB3_9BURK|nr:right-handed parallel beta-helix repeat-containing protein [Cupriavidus plantarum]PWK35246.1 parallel beta helix pectate lyase-like protein [Cupriavidus plantarum]RLK39112.1 parallel beta helix pectate lyase-like protein [Cupriavidus plantarum]CAG2135360.1 hypothetical protein LMG26296_02173 [Cupriavidus plantarum]SMR84557.1 Right handed beta helix region [Cupriavidus plantarum]
MKPVLRRTLWLGLALAALAAAAVAIFPERWHAPTPISDAVGAPADVPFGPNGQDQTDALQSAIDGLQAGQRLLLAPGSYTVSRVLTVSREQVVVSGYGATFVATNPDQQAIVMNGRNSTLVGLTLRGVGTQRLESATSAKVVVDGEGIQVLDVTIQGGASAGIFVSRGHSIALIGDKVSGTLADGIHITGGSRDVLVQDSSVTATGDDMVGIVSYQRDGEQTRNIYVTGNYLAGNAWGRGVAVVGSADVTVVGNWVEGVQKAAAIMVAQEDGYRTMDATNVLIASNSIADDQNATQPGNNRMATGHAAIDVNTDSGSVSRLQVMGNQIIRTRFDGFRAQGNICGVGITGNRFGAIGGTPIALLYRNCTAEQFACGSNTLDGGGLSVPSGCSGGGSIQVAGADASRLPQVRSSYRRPQ